VRIDVVTPPGTEPVSLAEAKADRRYTATDQDAGITATIAAARDYVEQRVGYALVTQTRRATLDCFPPCCACIKIPGRNIAVTSLKYIDKTTGTQLTLDPAAYVVDASGKYARIAPAYGTRWPLTRSQPGAVKVDFTSGVAANAVPPSLKQAILLVIGDLFENREGAAYQPGLTVGVENPAVENLIYPHRIVEP
jgi:uncharacterized phiE125 gp8 family phage protein